MENRQRDTVMKLHFRILIALALALPASAQFAGHNLLGDFGLKSGSQAAPGFYAGYLMNRYSTDTIRGPGGGTLPGSGQRDLTVYAHIGLASWVTSKKLFGADIGGMAAFPVVNLAIDFPRLDFEPQSYGYGDTYVQPLNLGWHLKRADILAGYAFDAPTGRYETGANDNLGRGFWSHELSLGSTVYLDQAKTWNVATTGFYELHTRREGDNAKVGDILTLEGGAGKTLKQIINVGVVYYAQWKMTTDEAPQGAGKTVETILRTKHRVYGVGPEFSIFLPTKMDATGVKSGLSFVARYFWETGAVNKTEGGGLTLSLAYMF